MILETDRLQLCRFTLDDSAFIIELVNDPAFLRYIGDKKVKTAEDAHRYLRDGPLQSYQDNGFGLYMTRLRDDLSPIGMCGLIKRDGLADVDIGYAFLPAYTGRGYAYEAAAATMQYARNVLKLNRVVAIVSPGNERSIKLLKKLGLRFEKKMLLPGDENECDLYAPPM